MLLYAIFSLPSRKEQPFPFLLSVLEVQWALAILMVLASLGHLVRLSLQWGHLDPTDEERFVEFCTTKSGRHIRYQCKSQDWLWSSQEYPENPGHSPGIQGNAGFHQY